MRNEAIKVYNDKIQDYITGHGIQWIIIIVELAPWMGSFYKSLVGITKEPSGVNCFTLTQLTTILTEVEAIANSRP